MGNNSRRWHCIQLRNAAISGKRSSLLNDWWFDSPGSMPTFDGWPKVRAERHPQRNRRIDLGQFDVMVAALSPQLEEHGIQAGYNLAQQISAAGLAAFLQQSFDPSAFFRFAVVITF